MELYLAGGSMVTHLTKGTDSLHFYYDAANRPSFVEYNGAVYAYVPNLQGDITGILDSTGTLVVTYSYDAWGKPIQTDGSLANTLGKLNPFRYRGYVFDEESNFCYLRNRYYSPIFNKFINADSKGNGNLFKYCNNMPIICLDFSGKDFIVITDTDSFTHTSALIQDSEGKWYYFYWGASKRGIINTKSDEINMLQNVSASSIPFPFGNLQVIYEPIDLQFVSEYELDMQALNRTLRNEEKYKYSYKDYEKYTYISGDFIKSHEMAKVMEKHADELRYHLTANDCAHAVYTLFLEAYNDEGNKKDKYYYKAKNLLRLYAEMLYVFQL